MIKIISRTVQWTVSLMSDPVKFFGNSTLIAGRTMLAILPSLSTSPVSAAKTQHASANRTQTIPVRGTPVAHGSGDRFQ